MQNKSISCLSPVKSVGDIEVKLEEVREDCGIGLCYQRQNILIVIAQIVLANEVENKTD